MGRGDITCSMMCLITIRMATLLAQHKFEEAETFANKFKLDLQVQLILVIWLFSQSQSINQSSTINHRSIKKKITDQSTIR